MFNSYSPFSFLFIFLYSCLLTTLLGVNDFFIFWLFIEIGILLFIGVAYSILTNRVSPLMTYLLVQSIASFYVLLSYISCSELLFSLAFLLNIGGFPFISWFLYSVGSFPPLLCYLALTFNNVPILVLMSQFSLSISPYIFYPFLVLNIFVAGALIINTSNLRRLIICSSVANNSWMLLGQASGTLPLFFFLSFYFMFLFLTFTILRSFSTLPLSFSSVLPVTSCLIVLSGLPPSPLFLANILILCSFPLAPYWLVVFLLASSLAVCSYVIYFMSFVTFRLV